MPTKNLLAVLFCVIINIVLSDVHPCPNACSGHGRCNSPSRQCECFEGFAGADCSLRLCPTHRAWADQAIAIDDAHNLAECSNMGICERETGLCQCREGFEGIACERQSCPNKCNGVGECQSMYYYALTKDPGSGTVYSYEHIWDAQKIYGCHCDDQYHGIDCSLRYCPKGDDPLTGTVDIQPVNPLQFNDIQRVSCKADAGTFTLSFRGKTTVPIPYNAKAYELQAKIEAIPTIGSGTTKLIMYGPQACTAHGTTFTIEFLQNFGNLPLLVPDKRKLIFSNSLSTSTLVVETVVVGTKEDIECAGRGICDPSNGICECSTFYETSNGYNAPGTRGDCGHATQLIQFCPGVIACSGHGECLNHPTYQCACSDGWTGADCSERLCPSDLAWFALPEEHDVAHITTYAECSNAGLCDRSTGVCTCQIGFVGAACARLTCPGISDEHTDGCSGHGKCLDMNSLASLSTVNGDLAGYTYGTTPNNPYTWDANRIYGCLCDPEYTGYDCSLYTCPYGDDPLTTGQDNEQQIISCTTSDVTKGTILLTFRQQTITIPLTPKATIAEVKTALESLTSIGMVSVETVDPLAQDQLCLSTGNQFLITFLTDHGDLPMIQYVVDEVGITVDITVYKNGNKEVLECSGRGLCDHTTGLCTCFAGYGSSNGMGQAGNLRDCGYQEPIVPNSAI